MSHFDTPNPGEKIWIKLPQNKMEQYSVKIPDNHFMNKRGYIHVEAVSLDRFRILDDTTFSHQNFRDSHCHNEHFFIDVVKEKNAIEPITLDDSLFEA